MHSWDLISFSTCLQKKFSGKCKECVIILLTIVNVASVYHSTLLTRFHLIGWNKQRLIVSVEDTIFLHSQVNHLSLIIAGHRLSCFFFGFLKEICFWATHNFLTINLKAFNYHENSSCQLPQSNLHLFIF